MGSSRTVLAALVVTVISVSVGVGVYFYSNSELGRYSNLTETTGTINNQPYSIQTSSNLSSKANTYSVYTTSYLYRATSTSLVPTMTSGRTFSYDNIPASSFLVGNFTIKLVNNQTGYTPTSSGSEISAFVFAFNVTMPNKTTTNVFSTWLWPPCSLNTEGVQCMQNDSWVQPTPEFMTANYLLASLKIDWLANATGLYVSFQEWDQIAITTTMELFTNSLPPGNTTISCTPTNETETVTGVSHTNDTFVTIRTWTTTVNTCSY